MRHAIALFLLRHVLHEGGLVERAEQRVRRTHQRVKTRLHTRARRHYAKRHPAAVSAGIAEQMSLVDHAALLITNAVGTMLCAALFACLALVSLPAALATHDPIIIVGWVAQTFLQLVLLPLLMVGGNLNSRHSEQRAEADFTVNQEALTKILALEKATHAQTVLIQQLLEQRELHPREAA